MTYTPKIDRIEDDGTRTPMALVEAADVAKLRDRIARLRAAMEAACIGLGDYINGRVAWADIAAKAVMMHMDLRGALNVDGYADPACDCDGDHRCALHGDAARRGA